VNSALVIYKFCVGYIEILNILQSICHLVFGLFRTLSKKFSPTTLVFQVYLFSTSEFLRQFRAILNTFRVYNLIPWFLRHSVKCRKSSSLAPALRNTGVT